MRSPFVASFASLLAVVVLVGSAAAGRGWCRSDPIVRIGDTELQIWIAIPEADQPSVTGPINVVIAVPAGTPRSVLLTDGGFNGFGEAITWLEHGTKPANGAFPVVVAISVPIAGGRLVPMGVEVIPQAGDAIYLGGQTIGLVATFSVSGSTIVNTSVVGASATGASATGAGGGSATGASAVGASASGATTATAATQTEDTADQTGATSASVEPVPDASAETSAPTEEPAPSGESPPETSPAAAEVTQADAAPTESVEASPSPTPATTDSAGASGEADPPIPPAEN